jgi:hypothetical protein
MADFVRSDNQHLKRFVTTVDLRGSAIRISVYPDDVEEAQTLAFGQSVAGGLAGLEEQAKAIAVRDLLETYNDGWREADDEEDDAPLPPELTAEQFAARLRLTAANCSGSDSLQLFFDDDGMFGGHSVVVDSFDAGATWTRANLYG